jgi:FkbM family methyltransferase
VNSGADNVELKSRELVFDIGLHNGDDTAYYLYLGYDVVGVEANPLLAEQCCLRFKDEIEQGRVTVVNAGVLKEPGEFTFYRSLHDDGWSSFHPEKGRKQTEWEELKIPCVTTQQLITKYGKPRFMKVDIEGADIEALHSLTPATAPAYVSLELNTTDPIIEALIELGYSSFKLVHGVTFSEKPPIFEHQVGWRLLRKIGHVLPFVKRSIMRLPDRWRPNSEYDPPGKHQLLGYPFTRYNSGPFGEQAAGLWLDRAAALRFFGTLSRNYRKEGTECWWDVHARRTPTAPKAR